MHRYSTEALPSGEATKLATLARNSYLKTSSAARSCRASKLKRNLRAYSGVKVANACKQIVAGAFAPVYPAWHGRSAAVSEPERTAVWMLRFGML